MVAAKYVPITPLLEQWFQARVHKYKNYVSFCKYTLAARIARSTYVCIYTQGYAEVCMVNEATYTHLYRTTRVLNLYTRTYNYVAM